MIASGWHVLLMVGLRHVYYNATGAGPYDFFDGLDNKPLYEFRKDYSAPTCSSSRCSPLAQWLIARAATVAGTRRPKMLAVNDGAVTHLIPVDEDRIALLGGQLCRDRVARADAVPSRDAVGGRGRAWSSRSCASIAGGWCGARRSAGSRPTNRATSRSNWRQALPCAAAGVTVRRTDRGASPISGRSQAISRPIR